jgi:hypothetical protein
LRSSRKAARPEYRKAVTVWMLIAHGMERMMTGFAHAGGGIPFRSEASETLDIATLIRR